MAEFHRVPLSKQTLTRRIQDITTRLSINLISMSEDYPNVSLALDENFDITDISQILVFIKLIQDDFTIIKDGMLKACTFQEAIKNRTYFLQLRRPWKSMVDLIS